MPAADLAEAQVALLDGEVDDTQHGAVALPELEELVGERQGDVVARPCPSTSRCAPGR